MTCNSRTWRSIESLGSVSLWIFRFVYAILLTLSLSSIERYRNGSTSSLQNLETSERLSRDHGNSEWSYSSTSSLPWISWFDIWLAYQDDNDCENVSAQGEEGQGLTHVWESKMWLIMASYWRRDHKDLCVLVKIKEWILVSEGRLIGMTTADSGILSIFAVSPTKIFKYLTDILRRLICIWFTVTVPGVAGFPEHRPRLNRD